MNSYLYNMKSYSKQFVLILMSLSTCRSKAMRGSHPAGSLGEKLQPRPPLHLRSDLELRGPSLQGLGLRVAALRDSERPRDRAEGASKRRAAT